jgi:outer membrane protein TolC
MMNRQPYPMPQAMCILLLLVSGCTHQSPPQAKPLSVTPTTQPTAALDVDASQIQPMYRQLLAVDLPTVLHVAMAQNIEIQQARQRVEASRGQYEASVEAVFPVIAPTLAGSHLQGVNQNANGTLTTANFTNFFPALSVQWIINPGQVVYDIVASKRRLIAAGQQMQAGELETTRRAAVQYYELILAQARVRVARQAVSEAEELLRIEDLRIRTGTGLHADELRAQATLAGAQQDLVTALNEFYQASVVLTVTLHLDPTVTLVPRTGHMNQTMLVRDDLPIDELLAAAVRYRPDLVAIRTLLQAAQADKNAVAWGGFGPQFQAAYTAGGLKTHVLGQTTALHEQQKATGSAGFTWGLSTFGRIKSASANRRLAALDVELLVDRVRAEVVAAEQNSIAAAKLIPVAAQQVQAAEESLRLTQANLKTGTMLTVDVLQAQDAADAAQLRYAAAVVHYNESQVDLLAALGLIEESQLTNSAPPTAATK